MTEENKSVMNFPNLRFPGFIGDWKVKRLEAVAIKIGDGLHGTPSYTDDSEYYFINGNNLVNGQIEIYGNTKAVTSEIYLKNNKNLNKNTLLISINGTIGNIAKYENQKVMLGKSICYLNFNHNSDFIFFLLNTKSVQDYFISELTGSTIKNLSLKTIRQTVLPFPSLPEQEKIAYFLSLIENRILTQKKIIEQLETLIRSYREKLFSQKIRFNENGSDFPEWEIKKIKDVLKIGSGRDYKHLDVGNIPVYGTGGVITFVDSFLYDGETVCVGRKGTIDRPMYFSGKLWTVDTLFYTHSFYNSIPKFIFQLFQTVNWKEHNEASGVPSLSKNTIENLSVTIPSLEEQTKVANFLSYLQEKIETEKKISAQYEIQKKYLLANLFA